MVFPIIEHIDECLPFVSDNFIVANKPGYQVINYRMLTTDTFPEDDPHIYRMRREFRGIKFDENGNILARPFHKFFNIGERLSTHIENVNLDDAMVMPKMDGSMIHPIRIGESYRLCTKMGITDTALDAESFWAKDKRRYNFLKELFHDLPDHTPIFEYIGPDNKIVVGYPEEKLILLAIRNNITGMYRSLLDIPIMCDGVEVIQNDPIHTISLDDIKSREGDEGVVIRLNTGDMLKMKSEWYVRIHRAKDKIHFEYNLGSIIINEEIDDLIPFLDPNGAEEVKRYQDDMIKGIHRSVDMVHQRILEFHDRKQYGLLHKDESISGVVFRFFGNKSVTKSDIMEYIVSQIKANSHSNRLYEKMKMRYFPDAKWNSKESE